MRRSLLLVFAALLLLPLLPQSASAAHLPLSCRASAIRVDGFEPVVANPNAFPCVADDAGLANVMLPGGLGEADALFAETRVVPMTRSSEPQAEAESGVAHVLLTIPGLPEIEATILTSKATACTTCHGRSTIASLRIGDTVIEPVPNTHQHISLGPLGTIHLNHQERTFGPQRQGCTVTQRALWVETPLGDVIVAEAFASSQAPPAP
jgi:hypothetical protein